ncbi:MAG: CinA family nicotinamide mononucleotide deamidase-related protein [bacterium]
MRIELLCTGHELLDGRVFNTNATRIGGLLYEQGWTLQQVTTVSDDWRELCAAIKQCFLRSDVLLMTGGLGPTSDDCTVAALAEVLGLSLEEREDVLQDVRAFFDKKGRVMSENNHKLAQLPQTAVYIHNDLGSAPAFCLEHEGRFVACLQGVPVEMWPLMKGPVLSRLWDFAAARFSLRKQAFQTRLFRCYGRGESCLAESITGLGDVPKGIEISYRATFPEVQIRLQAASDYDPQLFVGYCERVEALLSDHCFSSSYGSLGRLLIDRLTQLSQTFASAESCTGGLLASLLCSESGASKVFVESLVTYSNLSKQRLLGVSQAVLEQEGAVSEGCARAMLEGLLRGSGAQVGVAITGIAGPQGGCEQKPIGTVYIAFGSLDDYAVRRFSFRGDREQIQRHAALMAVLQLLLTLS